MNLSLNELNKLINIKKIPLKKLIDDLFNLGIEVESIKDNTNEKNIVVGKIISVKKHPKSNKLSICNVKIGINKFLQIICGAQNVVDNALVPVALIGAKLPNNVLIKKVKILNVESNGMICSLSELGYPIKFITENDAKGIHIFKNNNIKIGSNALDALNIRDITLDLTFTSNRFDFNSIYVLAGELAKYYNIPCKKLDVLEPIGNIKNNVSISLDNKLTTSYLCVELNDVQICESNQEIKDFLFKNNIRSINNIVDLTNVVMLELNQPMHAYDKDYIKNNKINITIWNNSSEYKLLNDEEKNLDNLLVISSGKQPLSVAGIIGCQNSSITKTTKNILLESAIWNPVYIRKAIKNLKVHTQAGVIDSHFLPEINSEIAIKRFIYLFNKYKYGSKISKINYVKYKNHIQKIINVEKSVFDSITGNQVKWNEFLTLISKIFKIKTKSNNSVNVIVPLDRLDITCQQEIIEQFLKFYGINKINEERITAPLSSVCQGNNFVEINKITSYFIDTGFYNVKTFTLISKENYLEFNELFEYQRNENSNYEIDNEISLEHKYIKNNNISELLRVLNYNLSRNNQFTSLSFFEIYNHYVFENNLYNANTNISFIFLNSTINDLEDQYYQNFAYIYQILKDIFQILNLNILSSNFSFKKSKVKCFNQFNSYNLFYKNKKIGIIGEIQPKYLNTKNAKNKAYYCELSLAKYFFVDTNKNISFNKMKKINLIQKDISFSFDSLVEINLDDFLKKIKLISKNIFEIKIFDVYFQNSTYSLAFRFYFDVENNEKIHETIQKDMQQIIELAVSKYKAKFTETEEFKGFKNNL